MDNQTKKRGRPRKEVKATKYTISLPAHVVPLAERAKTDVGLSTVIAECLQSRYQAAQPDRTTDARAEYRTEEEG